MKAVCIMDTTVFCNYLSMPGSDQNRREVLEQVQEYVRDGVTLLLPMAAVIEAGNLVAQCGDGNVRRQVATRFVKAVRDAVDGDAPWTPTPMFEDEALREWLAEFPDCAMVGKSFGDLTIIKEFARQCGLHPGRRVFIWSLDDDLSGHDRPAYSP